MDFTNDRRWKASENKMEKTASYATRDHYEPVSITFAKNGNFDNLSVCHVDFPHAVHEFPLEINISTPNIASIQNSQNKRLFPQVQYDWNFIFEEVIRELYRFSCRGLPRFVQ